MYLQILFCNFCDYRYTTKPQKQKIYKLFVEPLVISTNYYLNTKNHETLLIVIYKYLPDFSS